MAGATAGRHGAVWSLDDRAFDLSRPDERSSFARTIAPCVELATWREFVAWRASRSTTRTLGWTGAATAWTVYGPLVLGTATAIRAAAIVPEKRTRFLIALQDDLRTGPAAPPPPALVTWDLDALDDARGRQWQVPVAVGGGLAGLVGAGLILFYVSPPDLGLSG